MGLHFDKLTLIFLCRFYNVGIKTPNNFGLGVSYTIVLHDFVKNPLNFNYKFFH